MTNAEVYVMKDTPMRAKIPNDNLHCSCESHAIRTQKTTTVFPRHIRSEEGLSHIFPSDFYHNLDPNISISDR